MKNYKKSFFVGCVFMLFVFCAVGSYTTYNTLKLTGSGSDPELVLSNGEYLSNTTNGQIDFGAANLTTTGTLASSGVSSSSSGTILTTAGAYLQSDNVRFGYTAPDSNNAYGAILMKVYNKGVSGANIAAYDVVQIDTNKVEFAADTTKTVKARITNNIQFSCFAWLRITRPATTNADTAFIWGKDPAGTAIYEKVVAPAGSQSFMTSDNLYSDVDSIKMCLVDGNSGSYQFDAYYYNTVIQAAGSNNLVCGVAPAAIADSGGTGWVVIRGYAKAYMDAATLIAMPGTLLHGASGGDCVTIASATADSTKNAKILGHAMQPSFKDNTAVLIYVDPR